MTRALRIALLCLPWVLLAAVAFLAWLAWVHFQWKDRTLWERVLADLETAPAALESLQLGETAETIRALELRIASDCELLAKEGELAPDGLAARVETARRACRLDGFTPAARPAGPDAQR